MSSRFMFDTNLAVPKMYGGKDRIWSNEMTRTRPRSIMQFIHGNSSHQQLFLEQANETLPVTSQFDAALNLGSPKDIVKTWYHLLDA